MNNHYIAEGSILRVVAFYLTLMLLIVFSLALTLAALSMPGVNGFVILLLIVVGAASVIKNRHPAKGSQKNSR